MTAPTITNLEPAVTFDINTVGTPQLLDADVIVADPDANLQGGVLRVIGLRDEDILAIRNQGVGRAGVRGGRLAPPTANAHRVAVTRRCGSWSSSEVAV